MALNHTVLIALLKSESMPLVHLLKLSQPAFSSKPQLLQLLTKLVQSMRTEIDWIEEEESSSSNPFFERVYEYLLSLLPHAGKEHEEQLVDIFSCTETLLARQPPVPLQRQQMVLAAERVSEKIIDILQTAPVSMSEPTPVSNALLSASEKRYKRLLGIVFNQTSNPNSKILGLQRIVSHINRLASSVPQDTAVAILSYLLTDMVINMDLWTADTVASLFNHVTQLAVSYPLQSQCVFIRGIANAIQFCLANALACSCLSEKRVAALYTSLLHGLFSLADRPGVLAEASVLVVLSDAGFLADLRSMVGLVDDPASNSRYKSFLTVLKEHADTAGIINSTSLSSPLSSHSPQSPLSSVSLTSPASLGSRVNHETRD